jgi:hypothetical protein
MHRRRVAAYLGAALVAGGMVWFAAEVPQPRATGPVGVEESPPVLVAAGQGAVDGGTRKGVAGEHVAVASIRTVSVVVETGSGNLVAGAHVYSIRGKHRQQLGRTSTDGTVEVAVSIRHPPAFLAAWREGFAMAFTELPSSEGDQAVIVISKGGAVAGRVTLPDGSAAGPGIQVFATLAGQRPTERLVELGELSGRGQRQFQASGVTSADGEFRIPGLPLGRGVSLHAFGKGLAGDSSSLERFHPPVSGVVVVVYPLYGAVLEFVDANLEPLRGPWRPPLGRWSQSSFLVHGFDTSVALALSGIPTRADPPPNSEVFLYSLQGPEPGPGGFPVHYEGSIPGYRPFTADFRVRSVMGGVLTVQKVPLESNAEGWGRLTLTLADLDESLPSGAKISGRLVLTDSSAQRHEYPLHHLRPNNTVTIEDIPTGLYGVEFHGTMRSFVYPADGFHESILISEDSSASLAIPVPDLGYITLHAVDIEGNDHVGEVMVRLARGPMFSSGGPAKWMDTVTSFSSPLLIGPLEPGWYSLALVLPRPLPEGGLDLEVRPNSTTETWAVLPE